MRKQSQTLLAVRFEPDTTFTTPVEEVLEIFPSTVCIGRTRDSRAVWQNGTGSPFICVHDGKGIRHLFPQDQSGFTRIPAPYTYGSLLK